MECFLFKNILRFFFSTYSHHITNLRLNNQILILVNILIRNRMHQAKILIQNHHPNFSLLQLQSIASKTKETFAENKKK